MTSSLSKQITNNITIGKKSNEFVINLQQVSKVLGQKSWDRCHKTFEFQQTTIPRSLFNVVSHFSSGLMCLGLNNIDWGGGGEWYCV
jgi:hypothetical protein